uniref:Solute carrier family 30 member 10 n=1 Tax=Erpetoichthys calabaricus TaxID=27687 RepID=A0A8C4X3E6_ERPCA
SKWDKELQSPLQTGRRAGVRLLGNSIALVSDSFNMLSDLISLCVGISALRLARFQPLVLGAPEQRRLLTALCFTIFVQALMRLVEPQKISEPELVLIVGALGLAINIVGLIIFQECCFCKSPDGGTEESRLRDGPTRLAFLCRRPHTHRISCWSLGVAAASGNQCHYACLSSGVLLHVLGDALGSVVVVVAATIFYIWPLSPETPCNWECYVDPSLTVIMVIIIMSSAFPLLKETAGILLQMMIRLALAHVPLAQMAWTLNGPTAWTPLRLAPSVLISCSVCPQGTLVVTKLCSGVAVVTGPGAPIAMESAMGDPRCLPVQAMVLSWDERKALD